MNETSVRIWWPSVSYSHPRQQLFFRRHRRRLHNNNLNLNLNLIVASSSVSSTTKSVSSFTTSLASPPPPQWTFTQRHILLLNFIACAAGVSATVLFCSTIPTLLAFKRATESLEKLLDVTREELPDTMAAVRLSGMEISDLTMELSDLGQEITQGVKSSTRAVRVAEEKLRQLTNMNPSASMQQVVVQIKPEQAGPVVARTARGIRESIVKSRAYMQMFFSITHFAKVAFNYLKSTAKRIT
ncbi:uncharacterized protein LOC143567419 [Bidens hawaiensis]|uniref:uncharacterized protein LOC143567419 n=1 Tax=Bidens hawaiensis TaxID=980011 RepID=UPI0040491B18